MRKIVLLIAALLILTSFTSAEIIIKQQPKQIYNIGDSITIPITIKTISGISKVFEMNLICQDYQKEFYKNGISLGPGEEKNLDPELILTKEMIGETTGKCKIKGSLGEDYVITNEFEISDLINLKTKIEVVEFNPGESMVIKGNAQKKDGQDVNGFLNVQVLSGTNNDTSNIEQLGTIGNGIFSVNITFPEDMKAGTYLVKLDAYEMDVLGQKTNKGFMNYNILIKQVPRSLEVAFENTAVNPGENLKVRAILRDQTGEKINSGTAIITLKKEDNEIVEQTEVPIGEYYEYPVKYNEEPQQWTVVAVSNKLTSDGTFVINEKRNVEVVIVNDTINIVNTGNVPYNDLVYVKIGNETLELNVSLGVDGVEKYKLSAPEGEYSLEVVSGGEQKLQTSVILTGKAIDVKQIKNSNAMAVIRRPIAWVFIIIVLAFVLFMVLRKGIKKSFFGKRSFKKKDKRQNKAWENREQHLKKDSLSDPKNKAQLSLSINGEKHPASIVCLKIKNLSEIQKSENNVKQTLNKIDSFAEAHKAVIYENQDNLFFILSPTRTKTFKNEKTALVIGQEIVKEITAHNRLFKQRIDFGISLNYGNIISKDSEDKTFHFMSLGNLIASSKKLSTISGGTLIISEGIKERLKDEAMFQEHKHGDTKFYTIKQLKNSVENAKFISNFVRRMEKEEKDKKPKNSEYKQL